MNTIANKIIIPDSKAKVIKDDAALIQKESVGLTVSNWTECENAAFFLAKVVARTKRIEEIYDVFVKPFESALKDAKNVLKSLNVPFENVEADVRDIMGGFLTAYYDDLEAKAAKSKDPIAKPEFKIQTPNGLVYVTERWGFDVEDESKVPEEYLTTVVDSKKVNEAIRNGERAIPGLKIGQKCSVAFRQ